MIDPTVLAQSAPPLGDGKIDNWIISSSVHVVVGSLVLLTMTVATGWVGWPAIKGRSLDLGGKILISVAQVVLALQVLIGIKLLDQGQGIVQLYIHYLGGLPMGAFWPAVGGSAGRHRPRIDSWRR
ncbi:MAG: hypothetical protein R2710_28295 [Acidimicrobiales bacterium]